MSQLLDRPESARTIRPEHPSEKKATAVPRLLSLDAYRGFTMLAMVSGGLGLAHLQNDPTWGWLADQFEHRKWEGCTFWDLIQPSFMFIVGVAMPFAFALRQERGESWGQQFRHVCQRCLLLIGIGVFLDSFGRDFIFVQFIRVLQQIAIGYFLAFLVLGRGPKVQAAAAAALLIGHTAAFLIYGWSNGIPAWGQDDNVGRWVDRALHLPLSTGFYVTINAVSSAATILFGVLAGELLRSDWRPGRKVLTLAAAGAAGLLLGWGLTPVVPIVKRIWTASFALYAAGWTCWLLLAFYAVIEIRQHRRWAFPFVVVGMNSIAIYVAAGTLGSAIRSAIRPFLYQPFHWFTPEPLVFDRTGRLVGPAAVPAGWINAAPVMQALLVVGVLWVLVYWLYRHKVFFKV